jgi:hypothetical protein
MFQSSVAATGIESIQVLSLLSFAVSNSRGYIGSEKTAKKAQANHEYEQPANLRDSPPGSRSVEGNRAQIPETFNLAGGVADH